MMKKGQLSFLLLMALFFFINMPPHIGLAETNAGVLEVKSIIGNQPVDVTDKSDAGKSPIVQRKEPNDKIRQEMPELGGRCRASAGILNVGVTVPFRCNFRVLDKEISKEKMAIRELPAMPPKKSNLSNMRISVIPVIEKIWYNADFLRSKANEENFESIASHCPCYNFCGIPASSRGGPILSKSSNTYSAAPQVA